VFFTGFAAEVFQVFKYSLAYLIAISTLASLIVLRERCGLLSLLMTLTKTTLSFHIQGSHNILLRSLSKYLKI
jgi:hypothetical protein